MADIIEDSPYLAVSINEVKQFLHVDDESFNEALTNHIKLATRFIERMLGRSFLMKTYSYVWKRKAQADLYQVIKMPMIPVKSIVNIVDKTTQSRIRRFTLELNRYICINEGHDYVEFVFKAGMVEHPKDLDTEYKNLICMVVQAFFEDQDIETHPCMKVLKCYKENLCM